MKSVLIIISDEISGEILNSYLADYTDAMLEEYNKNSVTRPFNTVVSDEYDPEISWQEFTAVDATDCREWIFSDKELYDWPMERGN